MKRFIALLFAAALVCAALPVQVRAQTVVTITIPAGANTTAALAACGTATGLPGPCNGAQALAWVRALIVAAVLIQQQTAAANAVQAMTPITIN